MVASTDEQLGTDECKCMAIFEVSTRCDSWVEGDPNPNPRRLRGRLEDVAIPERTIRFLLDEVQHPAEKRSGVVLRRSRHCLCQVLSQIEVSLCAFLV